MIIDPKFYALAEIIRKELPPEQLAEVELNLPKIGAMVAMAGEGDHLDIGTGFGGSAIMAALVKKELGHKGTIHCIDPYVPLAPRPGEKPRLEPSLREFNDNAVKLNVSDRIVATPMPSYPLAASFKEMQFNSAYVDGDKNGMMPWLDFLSLRGIVTRYLAYGGFEEYWAAVMVGCTRALTVGGWILCYKEGTFFMMRRPVDVREWHTLPEEERVKRRLAMAK